jgi:hypothetical protein
MGRFIYTKYFMLNTVARFNYTKYWEILSDGTLGRFIYTNYWEIHYVEHWENIFTQNTGKYILLNTAGRFIYTKYSEILLC